MEENVDWNKVNPEHYKVFDKETFEMMIDIWGKEIIRQFCQINSFKYRMRLGNKPGEHLMSEFNKAKWYELKAIELKKEIDAEINNN